MENCLAFPSTIVENSGVHAPIAVSRAAMLLASAAHARADIQTIVPDDLAFFHAFDAGDATADFDGDGELTVFDLLAFQDAFDAGC